MYNSIRLVLVLLSGLAVFSCEKKSDSVIDPSYDSPVIVSVTKSTDTVSTTSGSPVIGLDVSAVVSENGGSAISGVECKLIDPMNNTLGTFAMDFAGEVSEGKRYSKSISAGSISCLLVGNYTVRFSAKNEAGLFSSEVNSPLYVRNTANVAPFIANLSLPDSVVRPASGSVDLTIYAQVIDGDGRCDISDVYFDAYRPSGFIIPGGSIPMTYFQSNDWKFTNPVLPSSADSSYGYFKYHFFAKDRSGAVSTGVWDSIKFVRP